MTIDERNIIDKEYILLDWNVIQYIKNQQHSHDDFIQSMNQIYKRYEFPFCEAHLRDLTNNFNKCSERNKEMINEDLAFLKLLSKSVAIGIEDKKEEFHLIHLDPLELFNDIISEDSKSDNLSITIYPQSVFQVDMQALDDKHPMRDILEISNGIYTPELMGYWMQEQFCSLFAQIDDYKKFRSYAKKITQDLEREKHQTNLCQNDLEYKNKLINCAMPFFNAIQIENEEELVSIWKDAIVSWLKINNSTGIPFGEQITTAYNMLDLHPLFHEKLKKNKNTLSNIIRDSKMIYFASSSKFFVSEDKNCIKKAKFILRAFNCKCEVITMEQFVMKFS